MKKTFRLICLLLVSVMTVGMFSFPLSATSGERNLCGSETSYAKLGQDDIYAAQINLSGDASAISVKCTNYGARNSEITLAVYKYDTDYTTSLIQKPVALKTFSAFTDKSRLSVEGDFKKGEYFVTAVSQDNCGVMQCGASGAQICYKNGKTVNVGISVSVTYVSEPSVDYLAPTKPIQDGDSEIDYAPCMDFYMDFRTEETYKAFQKADTSGVSLKYNSDDGCTVFRVEQCGDPFVWLDVPNEKMMSLDKYPVIAFSVRLNQTENTSGQMFFITETTGISEGNSTRFSYKADSDWQTVILDLSKFKDCQGLLSCLRWDIFTDASDSTYNVDLEYMAFFTCREAADAFDGDFEQYKTQGPGEVEDEERSEWLIDGSRTAEEYFIESGWGFISQKNIMICDGAVYSLPYSDYSIYSRRFPGDAYGYATSKISFDLCMTYGCADLGLRLLAVNDSVGGSGLWLKFNSNGEVILSEQSGYVRAVADGIDFSTAKRIEVVDDHKYLTVSIDGNVLVGIEYEIGGNTVTVYNGKGDKLDSFEHFNLPLNGYFRIDSHKVNGYLDNISYNRVQTERKSVVQDFATDYSTWVATDDLNRTTPMNPDVGNKKEDKYVGIFYFFTHSADMGSREIDDTTKIYLESGIEGLTKRMQEKAGRSGIYWAEPYFGYYNSDDEWIYRKHAQMLSAAGVDFIFLDNSNNNFYLDNLQVLLDTWLRIRAEGGNTPQIAFMFGDMPLTTLNGLYTLGNDYILNPKYDELMFKWEGKPLVLGNYDTPSGGTWSVSGTTPQSRIDYKNALKNNDELNNFYKNGYQDMLSKLTLRKCWAWQAGEYNGYWDWLQNSPQAKGTNPDGVFEQMAVEMGQHAHTGKGRSYKTNKIGTVKYDTTKSFGFELGTARYGYYFTEQFEYALEQDPQVIMITGWNEWYAGVMPASQGQTTGATSSPGFYLVDQFTPEYSRDGEPMKLRDGEGSVGFGDNYYYQMVSYIRRFKGMNAVAATKNNADISLTASDIDAQWDNVYPMFTDSVNDTEFRSGYSFSGLYLYQNATGRNDISYAKIAQDEENIYFYVKTASGLVKDDGVNWMNLFVNTDQNAETGWEGYDFVINRSRTDGKMAVEKFKDCTWTGETVGKADYVCGESSITVKVSKALLGIESGKLAGFDFKWADNSTVTGDVMQFMDLGDSAPDSRFSFRYTAPDVYRDVETQPETETETRSEATETIDESSTTDAVQTEENDTTAEAGQNTGCGSCNSTVNGFAVLGLIGAFALAYKRKRIIK